MKRIATTAPAIADKPRGGHRYGLATAEDSIRSIVLRFAGA